VHFDSPRVTTHNNVVVIDTRHIYPGTSIQAALMLNKELSVLTYSPEMDSEILYFLEMLIRKIKLHIA
jgi:hypothetical protein